MGACVPFLGLLVTVLVLYLPDLSGLSGRRNEGAITVTQLESTLRSIFPKEAYAVAADQIARLQEQRRAGRRSASRRQPADDPPAWASSPGLSAVIDAMIDLLASARRGRW